MLGIQNLVKGFCKVKLQHIQSMSIIQELSQGLHVCQQVGDSRSPYHESMLRGSDQAVNTEVLDNNISDNTLHHLTQNTCQRDWSVVARVPFCPFLVNWTDIGPPPDVRYQTLTKKL